MNEFGTLEITTVIGCKINCYHCPQNKLIQKYVKKSHQLQLSFEKFKYFIDKIPDKVEIHFSGMAEPWLNNSCTEMVLYAAQKGHPIAIYTTLVGMSLQDFKKIQHIPFRSFIIHLPDDEENSKIKITQNYIDLLNYVVNYFNASERPKTLGASCHGRLASKLEANFDENLFNAKHNLGISYKLVDRAGHLKYKNLNHVLITGPVTCGLSSHFFNHNVLLPNGDVVLCCNDYSMDYVIGNLNKDDYADLFLSEAIINLRNAVNSENGACLCRHCHNVKELEFSLAITSPLDYEKINNGNETPFISDLAKKYECNIVNLLDIWKKPFEVIDTDNLIVFGIDFSGFLDTFPLFEDEFLRIVKTFKKVILIEEKPILNELLIKTEILEFTGILADRNFVTRYIYIFSQNIPGSKKVAIDDFKVVALISGYNEVDIIQSVFDYLIANGILIYYIDNWSTDHTLSEVKKYYGRGLIGYEFFPLDGSQNEFSWEDILFRKQQLSKEIEADWFIHHDVDEIRESPWNQISLKEAIYYVDKENYNAIDFTVINFIPIDNCFDEGDSLLDSFEYFEFGKNPGHFLQIKAWAKTESDIDLISTGGHEIKFSGRKVFPIKFLLRHYPIRSQSHGIKKVFFDRKPRFIEKEREIGWHHQYDKINSGVSFLGNKNLLKKFTNDFYKNFLIERLTGINILEKDDNKFIVKNGICKNPNLFANKFSIEVGSEKLVFNGYQEFELTKDNIRYYNNNEYLHNKFNVVSQYLSEYYVKNRSILDLGANSGAYSYFALQNNAKLAIAIEMDQEYIQGLEIAKDKFFDEKLQVENINFQDVKINTDIVICLAVIHWFYSCTSKFGSLDKVIQKLSELTNYMIIIEWIDPTDPAIESFKHIEWNQDIHYEPYNYENFVKGLNKYFSKVLFVAELSSTRKIYIAYKTRHEISYNSPLPLYDSGNLLQSRILAVEKGKEYWSQLYIYDDYLIKQATDDLAAREGKFLKELEGGPFPTCYENNQYEFFSRISISRINGQSLTKKLKTREFNYEEIVCFVDQLFSILTLLEKKGITHRDIHAENLLLDEDDKVYLIDFGWAISEKYPYFTPNGLPDGPRLPDGKFSDVYSCGKLIELVNQNRFDDISYLVSLMSNTDLVLRVNNLSFLRTFFNLIKLEMGDMNIDLSEKFIYDLISQNKELYKKWSLLDFETNNLYKMLSEIRIKNSQLIEDINQKNNLINMNQDEIKQLYQRLVLAEENSMELNKNIVQLSQTIESINAEKIQLSQTIESINAEKIQLSLFIEKLSRELNEIIKSKSWKLILFARKVKKSLFFK